MGGVPFYEGGSLYIGVLGGGPFIWGYMGGVSIHGGTWGGSLSVGGGPSL